MKLTSLLVTKNSAFSCVFHKTGFTQGLQNRQKLEDFRDCVTVTKTKFHSIFKYCIAFYLHTQVLCYSNAQEFLLSQDLTYQGQLQPLQELLHPAMNTLLQYLYSLLPASQKWNIVEAQVFGDFYWCYIRTQFLCFFIYLICVALYTLTTIKFLLQLQKTHQYNYIICTVTENELHFNHT